MIIVQGLIPIKAGCEEAALLAAERMAAATRNESGCVSYEFYRSLSNPRKLLLLQEWESIDALSRHYRTDHMQDFVGELRELVQGEIVTRRYSVQNENGAPGRGSMPLEADFGRGLDDDLDDEPDAPPAPRPSAPIIH